MIKAGNIYEILRLTENNYCIITNIGDGYVHAYGFSSESELREDRFNYIGKLPIGSLRKYVGFYPYSSEKYKNIRAEISELRRQESNTISLMETPRFAIMRDDFEKALIEIKEEIKQFEIQLIELEKQFVFNPEGIDGI